jgi:hypothetical protein
VQNHTILSDCLAVDSAGHCERLRGIMLEFASLASKPLATHKIMKVKEKVKRRGLRIP